MRTTSAIESYNCYLGKKFKSHGKFYDLIAKLLNEDHIKTIELRNSINGVISIVEEKKKKFRHRDYKIHQCQSNIDLGKITINDFLNQITCSSNKILKRKSKMCTLDGSEDETPNEEEPNTSSKELQIYDQSSSITDSKFCIICYEHPRQILLLPYSHGKLCYICFAQIATDKQKSNQSVRCPYCNQVVTNSQLIFV